PGRAPSAGPTDRLAAPVVRREDRNLLGVHVLGDLAPELIHEGQAVLNYAGTIDYFSHSTFNVPTESEAYKYAAYDGLQRLRARRGHASEPESPDRALRAYLSPRVSRSLLTPLRRSGRFT